MKRFEQILSDFDKALSRLNEAVPTAKSELEMDGVIQRFEFAFELSWKTMKRFLEMQGLICNSPRGCLKEAFQAELIQNEAVWLQMLADRNASTHLYDQTVSREIFNRIKTQFISEFLEIHRKMSGEK